MKNGIFFNFLADDVRNMAIMILFDQFDVDPSKDLVSRHQRYIRMLKRTDVEHFKLSFEDYASNQTEYRLLAWPMIIPKSTYTKIEAKSMTIKNDALIELFKEWTDGWAQFFTIHPDGKPPKT
jgi:hypothetical protein